MIVPFLAALTVAALSSSFVLVDDRGQPVSGATVTFHRADGTTIAQTSAPDGRVPVPSGADAAASVTVSGTSLTTETVALPADGNTIVVHTAGPGVIGKVSVATGSARSLHNLAVPAASLDQAAIATTPYLRTDALLRSLPGFDFVRSNSAFTNYGNLRVSFTGAGEDRGLVLADGVPAQDGFGGQVDWLAFPPVTLQSAELLRGPGAALYGANAVGGVLSLRSVSPSIDWRTAPSGAFELQDGTHHTDGANLGYRFTLAPNLTAAVSTATTHQAYADFPTGYTSPIDQEATASSTATRALLRYGFGSSAITLGGLFANDDQFEGRRNYTFSRNLDQGDIHFTTSSSNATFDVTGYDRATTIINTNDQSPTAPGKLRYVQNIPTLEGGVGANYILTEGDHQVAIRADERAVYGDAAQVGPTGALQSAGTGRQHYAGVALEDTYEHGRWQLIAGARADIVSLTESALVTSTSTTNVPARSDRVISPRVAARYDITKTVALRASTGSGFREPYLNELVRGYRIGAIAYNPNPNLVPERSASFGLGADALVGAGRLSLDFAQTQVKNAIGFLTTAKNVQTRSNVAQTQTDSTTLTYTTQLARCTRLRAYATTQYARIIKGPAVDLGNRLQYVPNRSGDVAIDSGNHSLDYGADLGYAGASFADDLNTEVLPAALIIGAHITKPLGDGASLSLEGTNIGGDRYLSSIDRYGPPPTVSLRLRFGLGPHGSAASDTVCP